MDDRAWRFAGERRSATLATTRPSGRPRLVPICFVLAVRDGVARLYSALDEKPKRVADVRRLARVRDLLARPRVDLLFDRWSEDWARLGWVRASGAASLVEPDAEPLEHADAVRLLRDKYPPYESQRIDRLPLVRVTIDELTWWGDLDPDPAA